jgi:hypothetical protein
MGIFKRGLDYSSGNGVLPKLDSGNYMNLELPSFAVVQVANFELMAKERDAGNIEKALDASVAAFHNVKNSQETREFIEKYLGDLVKTLAPDLDTKAIQFLANCIGVGLGMAIVEYESGLMLKSKSHPSIVNIYFRMQQNLGNDLEKMFPGTKEPSYLVQMAMEIGYVGTRLGGSISAEEMMKSIKPF